MDIDSNSYDESEKKTKVEEIFNDSVKDKKKKNIDIKFEGETFSVYGIVYTVDFEYTDPTTGEVIVPDGSHDGAFEVVPPVLEMEQDVDPVARCVVDAV